MLTVIGLMVAGILLGYLLRERSWKGVPRLINAAILLLLFLLGITVGADESIMNNLGTIGKDALVITLAAVAGSVLCAWVVYKYFFYER